MSIISSIKKFFGFNTKVRKIKMFYIKAFKAYDFADDFLRMIQLMNFDKKSIFVRTCDNTVVYMILKKDDTLILFMPKSYLEEVEKLAKAHKIKITGAEDA